MVHRIGRLTDRLSRARYFRGHGVHSPFIYSIVRDVLMRRRLESSDTALFDALTTAGLCCRRAVQLQNLFLHCRYSSFGVDSVNDADMCVLTMKYPFDEIVDAVEAAEVSGATLVVISSYADRDRDNICRRIIASHRCTTVDNRAYLVIFNNHLPKQHFRI